MIESTILRTTLSIRTTLAIVAAAVVLAPLTPSPTAAQSGRFQVLVTNLKPEDATRPRFGERAGSRVRDELDLETHVAVSERDVNRAGREYDLSLEDLDCVTSVQLATLMNLNLVICGTYRTEGSGIRYSATIMTVPGLEQFSQTFDPVPEGQDQVAGDQILAFFSTTKERLETIAYCLEDFSTQNWQGAAEYCVRALEAAPTHKEARTAYGRTLMELGRHQEALEQFQILLEADAFNSMALETAGYLAAQTNQREMARDYYGRFLELNPTNVQVRGQIARDLASAGDDLGAMRLLEAGIEQDSTNVDLHDLYGAMAFRAAFTLERDWLAGQPAPAAGAPRPQLPTEIADLYRTSIRSHTIVLDARSAEMRPADVRNMLGAYVKVGDTQGAVALADRIITFFRENPEILGELAVTYNQGGFIDRAVELTERALALRPDLPDARFRLASFLLGANRIDEAILWANRAREHGEREPDVIGGLLYSWGWTEKAQKGDRLEGIRLFEAAKAIPGISPGFRSSVDYLHGFVLYQHVEQIAAPATPETARQTLPMFRDQVLPLLQGARTFAESSGQQAGLQSVLEGTNTYIQIQEAIIARAERAAGE